MSNRGRKKLTRKTQTNPLFKSFSSKYQTTEKQSLSIDEFEAIKLMDFFSLYQDECASSMQISRTTFGRVLKSAREKIASFLIFGGELVIESNRSKKDLIFFSNDRNTISSIDAKFLVYISVDNFSIEEMKIVKNPILKILTLPYLEQLKQLKKIFENSNVIFTNKMNQDLLNVLKPLGIIFLEENGNFDEILQKLKTLK